MSKKPLTDKELKVGDRVRHKYNRSLGTIVKIWDGKYNVSYYEGEQYNPYRITVKTDHQPGMSIEFYAWNCKLDHLEKIEL